MNQDMVRFFEKDKFAAFVGIKLVELQPGYAKASLEITDKHLNPVNMVHGGVMFTLADFTFGAASNSQGGQVSVALNANISYFKSPKGKILTAEAKEVSSNKKISGYMIDIFDENKELIAQFNGIAYRRKDKLEF